MWSAQVSTPAPGRKRLMHARRPPAVGRGSAGVRRSACAQVKRHTERRRTAADQPEWGAMVVRNRHVGQRGYRPPPREGGTAERDDVPAGRWPRSTQRALISSGRLWLRSRRGSWRPQGLDADDGAGWQRGAEAVGSLGARNAIQQVLRHLRCPVDDVEGQSSDVADVASCALDPRRDVVQRGVDLACEVCRRRFARGGHCYLSGEQQEAGSCRHGDWRLVHLLEQAVRVAEVHGHAGLLRQHGNLRWSKRGMPRPVRETSRPPSDALLVPDLPLSSRGWRSAPLVTAGPDRPRGRSPGSGARRSCRRIRARCRRGLGAPAGRAGR
jgi:hypothetical protein